MSQTRWTVATEWNSGACSELQGSVHVELLLLWLWDLSGGWGYRSGAETLALVDQMARIRIQKKQINMSLIPVWYHICQLNGNIFFLYYKPLLLPHLCLIKHKLHFLSFKIKFIRIYLCFSSGRWDSAWIFLWNSCTVYICVVVVLFVVFFLHILL